MFDKEIKNLYAEFQQDLKFKSESSLTNIEQEISSIRNNIVSRINDMISEYEIQVDSNVLENIVDSTLIEDLKQIGRKTLSKNYQTLYQFNGAINSSIMEQAKKQINKSVKEEQLKVVMDKFDYTMSEYKKNKIDLLEQYNRLFKTILSKTSLYSSPDLVQEIKIFLNSEKESMESYIQQQRNKIITSNFNKLVLEEQYLIENTDLVSLINIKEDDTSEEIREEENKLEEQIHQEYIKSEQTEQEVKAEQEKVYQEIEEQVFEEKQLVDNQSVYSSQSSMADKILSAPSFKSNENMFVDSSQRIPRAINSQSQASENYRILDDGTIEWIEPHKTNDINEKYRSEISKLNQPPSKESNDQLLIAIVKKNVSDNLWNEIGLMSSNTDNTIDILSNQILQETQEVLKKYGIQNNNNLTSSVIQDLKSELKEINNNLSTNMIKSFSKINEETINSISQTFYGSKEIQEQDVSQCMEVYRQSTSLASFRLTCEKQFEQCMSKICYEYKINKPSNIYNDISRIMENNRIQMESQFYNMYTSFTNSNSMFIDKAIGSTIMTQDIMKEMQQDFTQSQVQQLISYNYHEYEKNYYTEKAEHDLEELRGMLR